MKRTVCRGVTYMWPTSIRKSLQPHWPLKKWKWHSGSVTPQAEFQFIKKISNSKCGQGSKWGTTQRLGAGGVASCPANLKISMGVSQKSNKMDLPYKVVLSLLCIYPKGPRVHISEICIAALLRRARLQNLQPTCPTTKEWIKKMWLCMCSCVSMWGFLFSQKKK